MLKQFLSQSVGRSYFVAILIISVVLAGCAMQPISVPDRSTSSDAATDTEPASDSVSVEAITDADMDFYLAASRGDIDDVALPLDDNLIKGTLDNGLTYYIRQNSEPENRAELRLVVKAGSILEEEDQLGLAHFLEHMMFNGTARFEKQEIVSYLEGLGIEFGPDLNAYTSFDETVYILRVPTDNPDDFKTAFEVLEDWAGYATLDPEEIDKERGVIVEEWRGSTQNAQGRLRQETLPVLFGEDSRYAQRQPIGDMDVVRTAPREAFSRFYDMWYRPDLMAVIAVGDFETDIVETMIVEHFSELPEPENPEPRPEYDVPAHEETRYLVASDPENPDTVLQIMYKRPSQDLESAADYRDIVVGRLFSQMLNARLDEISRDADAPFITASAGEGRFVNPVDVAVVSARLKENGVEIGLESILTELERVQLHGFTESELERVKLETLRSYEGAYNERANNDSGSYAAEYIRNFLEGEGTPGIAFEYALVQKLLPDITVDEVNEQVDDLIGEENRTVILTAPEKDGFRLPSENALAAIATSIAGKDIEPYVDAEVDGELMVEIPNPVEVVDKREISELGVTVIELANGVTVMMKPTDFKDDEVVFSAVSPGGTSLVEDEEFVEAEAISAILAESGVSDFDATELNKLLAGQDVFVAPSINDLSEGLSGAGSPQDLETLFQLIHLYVTEPRLDEDVVAVWQNRTRVSLENRSLEPFSALQDALTDSICGESVRCGPPSLDEVNNLDAERGLEIYQDRFADMSDFTFVFAGNFDVEELTTLAQTYLGTLPSSGREESWRDVEPDPPTGIIETDVYAGQEDQSLALLYYIGETEVDPDVRMRIRVMENILNIRVRNALREELGGTYSPFAFAGAELKPDPLYTVGVFFGTNPDQVDELLAATRSELTDLKENGPSEENLAASKEQIRRAREEQVQENSFWVDVLSFYVENPEEDVLDILLYTDRLDAVTAEEVQSAAQEYLRDDQYIQIVLYPEALDPEDG